MKPTHMRKLNFKALCLSLALVFFSSPAALAKQSWEQVQGDIAEIERNIYKLEEELAALVERKKMTRDHSRVEAMLQRIVEIHAALIGERKRMDNVRMLVEREFPDKANVIDEYDSRASKSKPSAFSKPSSRISKQLDALLLKVKRKFGAFIRPEDKNRAVTEVENIVEKKQKARKEREADAYLRKKSKVRLVK